MKVIFKILFCLAFIGSFSTLNAQLQTGSFVFEGRTRNYEVYLPQNFQSNMPVVISLHGYTETIQWYKDYTLLHEFADTAGFITVYPAAIDRSWNSGLIAPGSPPIDTTVDDVGFISVLIDTLVAHYNIDLSRVYCCGYSLGGEMTYRLAIELGYRFAAVASVTGLINDVSGNLGDPIRPLPILHIHGTADTYETWWGDNKNLWTVPETIDYWLEKNGCSSPADSVPVPDIDPTDGCTVEKISYTNCSDEGSFIFYKIHNGGHHWPDAAYNWGGGNLNRDINANEEIWNFFKNYQNPLVNLAYAKSIEVYPKYMPPQQGNTLKLSAQISNPENHQVTVQALIQGKNNTFKDSLQLFDDGLHNDSLASDNIFGGIKSLDALDEDYFDIQLRTTDLDESLTTYNEGHFTTIGPVVYDTLYFYGADTIPEPGDRIIVYLTLRNNGSTAPATGVKATISSADPCVSGIARNNAVFADIPAGDAVTGTGVNNFFIDISDDCPGGLDIKFALSIDSQGYPFWSDSFSIHIYDPLAIDDGDGTIPAAFALHQNYPNPFNPTTTIQFDLPMATDIHILVYDLLGREVVRLLNQHLEPGFHELIWNGRDRTGRELPSGMYIVLMATPEYTKSIKMLLLK